MLVKQPGRFGKVLMRDPVTTLGLERAPADGRADADEKRPPPLLRREASAAPTLFRSESLPRPAAAVRTDRLAPQRQLFEHIIERTTVLSDGIWFGTPQDLEGNGLPRHSLRRSDDTHEHLVLCGKLDYLGAAEHFDEWPQAACQVQPRSLPLHRPLDEPGGSSLFAGIFAHTFRPD